MTFDEAITLLRSNALGMAKDFEEQTGRKPDGAIARLLDAYDVVTSEVARVSAGKGSARTAIKKADGASE